MTASGTVTAAPAQLIRLNLGANNDRRPGFLSVDIAPPADMVVDLRLRWPWNDSEIEEVYAAHIFEHLPDRIFTMNQLWRVLRPGGTATIIVPSASHGAGFAQDPTHVSQWCMNSFLYYEQGAADHKRLHAAYGITARFKVRELSESNYVHHHEPVYLVHAVLEAMK